MVTISLHAFAFAAAFQPLVQSPTQAPSLALVHMRTPQIAMTAEATDASDDPPYNQFALSEAWKRMKASYAAGYTDTKKALTPNDDLETAPTLLRTIDLVSTVVLACIFVEAATFGGAVLIAWLMGASPAFAASSVPQVRLFAALSVAADFRSRTRLWRLFVEFGMLPFVAAMAMRRPVDKRTTFFIDRAAQSAAIVATVALTMRACNRGWLAGTTDAAALVLWGKLVAIASPLLSRLPEAPGLSSGVASAAHAAWGAALAGSAQLRVFDAHALAFPPVVLLNRVANLEAFLWLPLKFAAAALRAFYLEVVLTGVKRLGWLTVQTLG